MNKNIIKVYNKEKAPKDSILICDGIEKNGIFDINVQTYNILDLTEKRVYFYYIPLEKDLSNKTWCLTD